MVLEYLPAHAHEWRLHFWRDVAGREFDFVIVRSRNQVDTIGGKWDPTQLDLAVLKVFRSSCLRGRNYLVSPVTTPGYARRWVAWRFLCAIRKC